MRDKELPSNRQPEEDLSAFENALSDDALDSLPSEMKTDEPHSEVGIIRKVLQELSEKYGFEYQIYDGRGLGYELALNHRLDDMRFTAPRSLNDELTLSIQENRLTEKQARELYERLSDPEELDFKNERQLQTHLYHIYQVLEVVVVDPQRTFDSDLEAQGRLISSLQSSADSIQGYIDNKPERDRESLPAKQYLTDKLDSSMRNIRRNFADWHPEFIEPLAEVHTKIQAKVDEIPEDLKEARGHLVKILKAEREISQLDRSGIVTDEQKLEDVLTMISDL